MPTEGLSANLHPVALAVRELEDAQRRAANANDTNLAKQIGDTAWGLRNYLIDAARAEGPAEGLEPRGCPIPGACACPSAQSPARERLEKLAAQKEAAAKRWRADVGDIAVRLDRSQVRGPRWQNSIAAAEAEAFAADLRTVLAELDRRSPPTREGGWVLVPREPSEAMVAMGFEAIRMEEKWPTLLARVYTAMLAAAPPPPDVP